MTANEFIHWILYEECVLSTSPDGAIYKKKHGEWKRLTGTIDIDGYIRVNIQHKGIRKNLRAHRIIWADWRSCSSLDGMTINHIDFCKTNNCLSNLELLSNEENARIKRPK